MNKPPISFRLSDKEWELLERENQSNESINQTAARLLRERLGSGDVDGKYTLEYTTLDNLLTDIVNDKIEAFKMVLTDYVDKLVDSRVDKLTSRLEAVENKVVKSRTRATKKVSENS